MDDQNCLSVLWAIVLALLPNVLVNNGWDIDERCLKNNRIRSFKYWYSGREFEIKETNPLLKEEVDAETNTSMLDEYTNLSEKSVSQEFNPQDNVALMDEVTFNMKLHWVAGACWQEEWDEKKWCMQCEGLDCNSGDILELKVCSNLRSQRFQWLSNGDDTGRLKTAHSDLCLQNNGDIILRRCSGNQRQTFKRSSMNNVFEMYPKGFEEYCLSQQHHPKAGEKIFAEDCFLARKFLTSKWHIYWDSTGNSDPNDDGYPGINNNGTSGPELSLRGNCNNRNPCGMCEGDCNRDAHCEGSLRCFQRETVNFIPGCSGHGEIAKDYCYLPPEGKVGSTEYHALNTTDVDDRRNHA